MNGRPNRYQTQSVAPIQDRTLHTDHATDEPTVRSNISLGGAQSRREVARSVEWRSTRANPFLFNFGTFVSILYIPACTMSEPVNIYLGLFPLNTPATKRNPMRAPSVGRAAGDAIGRAGGRMGEHACSDATSPDHLCRKCDVFHGEFMVPPREVVHNVWEDFCKIELVSRIISVRTQ